jgi:hypothetical protein
LEELTGENISDLRVVPCWPRFYDWRRTLAFVIAVLALKPKAGLNGPPGREVIKDVMVRIENPG